MKKVSQYLLFSFLITFANFGLLNALVVEYISLDRLTKEANLIVIGKVISSYSVWEDNCIYTYTTISIMEKLKGETASKKIVVKQMGGTVGEISQAVDGTPKLITGSDVVLFLRYWKGAYWIHSIVMGYYNVIEENGMKYAFNNLNNVGLIDPVTKRVLDDPNRKENRFELNTFLSTIKQFVKS